MTYNEQLLCNPHATAEEHVITPVGATLMTMVHSHHEWSQAASPELVILLRVMIQAGLQGVDCCGQVINS